MARMRPIGTTLDDGYRDDLNFNFGLLEALIGESNGLTEALRQEMIDQIYNLQQQIDMLTGENIGELLARLNDAIQQALTAAQEARTAKTATEEATALAIAAKELAIASATLADEKAAYAEGKAILAQEAADNANQEAANLGQMKVDVVKATQDANTATSSANQATQEAQTATNAINAVLPNVTGLENLQEWSSTIAYKKNNFVTFEGNGYMALQNNINISPPSFPTLSNDDWGMLVQKGEKGEQGTGVRILGTLVNESELPSIGEPGDAYLINGDLYVWSDTTNDWTNVGTIKGPKGDQGIQGPKGDKGDKGDPGEDADVEAINQQINTLRTEVTEQLDQMKPKVDNSWQKGVYNDTDIMNLKSFNVSRVFHITDWEAPVSNIEQVSIVIPATIFGGTVKVSVTGSYMGTDGSGAIEYETSYLKIDNTVHTYNRTIYKADIGIATQYYFPDFNRNEHVFTIPIVRKPHALNRLSVKVELLGVYESFNMLKDAYLVYEDLGTSWNGYPWTPQTSQIPTYAQIASWSERAHYIAVNTSDSDPNIETAQFFITSHSNVSGVNGGYWYVENKWFNFEGNSSQMQIATSYHNKSDFKVRCKYLDVWEEWSPSLQDLKSSVSDGKTKVASAITDKGVPTSPTATFDTMANNISAIPTGVKKAEFDLQTSSIIPNNGTGTITTPAMNFQPTNASNTMLGTTIFRGIGGDISGSTSINVIPYIEKCTINNIGNGNYTVTFTIRNKMGIDAQIGLSLRTTITG